MLGKIAIANSKVVYRRFMEIFHGEGFASLRSRGARVQRPLWASTGTKNPAYSDVLYVENLIGPETVNTLPPDTINAFRDHGKIPGATVKTGFDDADAALATLAKLGINLDAITEKLQVDGVASFSASFDQLMAALEKKRQAMAGAALNHQELHLGKSLKRVEKRLKDWQTAQVGKRIWEKDHKVWSKDLQPELTDRLGWLELPETMEKEVAALRAFADKAKADGMKHVVLLGMGGSSLAPEVFQETFGNAPGYPKLRVLDSTHPAAVQGGRERHRFGAHALSSLEQVGHDHGDQLVFLLLLGQTEKAWRRSRPALCRDHRSRHAVGAARQREKLSRHFQCAGRSRRALFGVNHVRFGAGGFDRCRYRRRAGAGAAHERRLRRGGR